eukprot:gene9261-34911_t
MSSVDDDDADPADQVVVSETPEVLEDGLAKFRVMYNETATAVEDDAVPKFNFDDDMFILRFLRAMKFDVERAVELYKKYNPRRSQIFGNDQGKLSFDTPGFKKVALNEVMVVPHKGGGDVPARDKWGRRVAFFRPRNIDYEKFAPQDMLKHVWVIMDNRLENEDVQRNGIVAINNAEGMSRKNFSRETVKLIMDSIQNAIPIRMAGFYIVNSGMLFKVVFPIVRVFMSKKLRKRFLNFGSDQEALKEYFTVDNLPRELGGTIEWEKEDHYKWLAENGATNVPGINDAASSCGGGSSSKAAPKVVAL